MKVWKTRSGVKISRLLSGRSNVFLLSKDDKNIIIDTSTKGNWKRLDKKLNKLDIKKLDYLILTHTHFDHSENAAKITDKYKALLILNRSEAHCLANGEVSIPGGTNSFTRIIVKLFKKEFAKRTVKCQFDILTDSIYDMKDLGFDGCYIIHTPGHSPGSISVIVNDEIAIVGDTMFGAFKWSAFPPYAVDAGQMIQSWGKLLKTNCYTFLPSHGTADSRQLLQKEYDKRKWMIKTG